MTSKERVKLAYAHKEADRVPVGEMHIMSPVSSEILGRQAVTGEGGWLKHYMAECMAEGNRAEFIERLSEDTVEVFRKSGLDLLCTELDPADDGSVIYKDVTENSWTTVDQDTGHWAKFVYKPENDTAHEVDSSEKSDTDEDYGAIREHLDALEKSNFAVHESRFDSTKYAVKHAGKDMFIMAKLPDLIPSYRSFYANFMEVFYTDEELAHRLCDDYLAFSLNAAKRYIEIGVDCIMIATDWAASNGPIFSPRLLREFMIPQIRAVVDLCHQHDVLVLKHTDGNIMQFADEFFAMGIDGYQSVEPGAGMDIELIKKLYGEKVLLMGNVDCAHTLPFGTPEDVIEETKQVMRKASGGGGHIVSSSNTIGYPTTAKNFLTMVETVHKFGSYPLEL